MTVMNKCLSEEWRRRFCAREKIGDKMISEFFKWLWRIERISLERMTTILHKCEVECRKEGDKHCTRCWTKSEMRALRTRGA